MSNNLPFFDEPKVRQYVDLNDIYPLVLEVLENEGKFLLTPTGNSMYPTIRNGRDKVTVKKPPEKLKKYDLPFYRRKNGQFVMHRIVSVDEDGTYTCCGDHQWVREKGITDEQIFGIVTELVRNGKHYTPESRGYSMWVRFWVWFLPARKFVFTFKNRVRWVLHLPKAAFRHFFKKKTAAEK